MTLISLQAALAGLGSGDPVEHIVGTKESGPGGVESLMEYNGLLFNNSEWIDTIIVTDIGGLDDADVRDSRENNPEAHGETPGNAFYGGRSINLQGKIKTRTLWKLHDLKQALRTAFVDISVERPLIFHGVQSQYNYMILCKKSQKLDIPEKQTTANHFERTFNLILRASNPRIVSYNRLYEVWENTGAAATIDDVIFNPRNTGNFPAQSYLELTGPMNDVVLANESNGNVLALTGDIPDDEVWVADFSSFQPRIYRKSDGESRWDSVSDLSTDMEYIGDKADNNISLSATGMTDATKVESWHRHTIM